MDEDRIAGAAKEFGGQVQREAGALTGDPSTWAEGRANEAEGAAQTLYGRAKEAAGDVAGMVGDAIERGGIDRDRIAGTATELRGEVQSAVADVTGGERDRVEGRRRQVEGRARDAYGRARDAARDTGARAGDLYDDYAGDGVRAVRRRAGENPLLGLLIAGAAGYGLALLIHARR